MHGWTNDERMMITCCNDGTRPVVFKIERIDIPENEDEKQWLENTISRILLKMHIQDKYKSEIGGYTHENCNH